MTSGYEHPFHDLNDEIRQFSPQSAVTLEILRTQCGTQAAYYAAFILICLQAKAEQASAESQLETRSEDLQAFTFFEFCRDDSLALDLHADQLASVVVEHFQGLDDRA